MISYAATSALAKQVEQGADADVFISADLAWMDYLAERNLIDPKTRFNLLANQLVLIAPKDSEITTTIAPGFPLAKLLGDGRLAIAGVDAVPAGKYGKAALQSLGVWDDVKDKLAQAENVRAALRLVSRAEAPLGIVYASDAKADPNVKVVGVFPADSHPPIVYPAAKLAASRSPAADGFLDYLRSSAAAPQIRGKRLRRPRFSLGASSDLRGIPHSLRGDPANGQRPIPPRENPGDEAYAGVSVRSPRLTVEQGSRGRGLGFILSLTCRGQWATVDHEIPTVVRLSQARHCLGNRTIRVSRGDAAERLLTGEQRNLLTN